MKPKKRQKMCYNCEGEVDLDVIVCPFCAADLREEKPEQQTPHFQGNPTLKNADTQASLYPSSHAPRIKMDEAQEMPMAQEEEESGPKSYGSILLLTLGAQLLILGFFMLLFSSKGMLLLKWDARFWYFYVLAAIPLLIFGFKSLNKNTQ